MKVLVTGADGQLGHDIIRSLNDKGIDNFGLTRSIVDISDQKSTADIIRKYSPDVIIHCAAYTNVDLAEIESEKCRKVNVDGTANIANVCKDIRAKMVYISTDYVFSGNECIPYNTDSVKFPISIYGQTKLDGENEVLSRTKQCFIVRTSWSFGGTGNNFVNTMLSLGKKNSTIDIVSDQIGSPTYTKDLSELIIKMMSTEKYGVYHATNEGFCSRADFAKEIFTLAEYKTKINYILTDDYPTRARRPKNSRLSKESLDISGFERLPKWQDSLKRYLVEINAISEIGE